MTLAEIRHSLRQRLSQKVLWGAFAFVLLAYAGSMVWEWHLDPYPMGVLAGDLLTSALFYFAFIWLSHLPWQWDGRPGLRSPTWRSAALALALAEASSVLMVATTDLGRVLSGVTPTHLYLLTACFQGPALFLVGSLVAYRERTEIERAEMRLQVLEAQDRHLRGQLHPHVLFNALNGLAELVHEDTLEAESHIRAMSTLLRRILDAGEVETYTLSEERALVENYLQVESIRLGERLRVDWDWSGELDGLLVPPLLMQPLVENAVKHGLVPMRSGGDLRIAAHREGDTQILSVRNTGRPLPGNLGSRSGIGIKNLRKRLELAYQGSASFQLRQEDGWTVAEIRLETP